MPPTLSAYILTFGCLPASLLTGEWGRLFCFPLGCFSNWFFHSFCVLFRGFRSSPYSLPIVNFFTAAFAAARSLLNCAFSKIVLLLR